MKDYIAHISIPIHNDELMDMPIDDRYKVIVGEIVKSLDCLYVETILEYPSDSSAPSKIVFPIYHEHNYTKEVK